MALSFEEDLQHLINRHSAESPSGTPDYILAEMLTNVLKTFNEAVGKRAKWRGESVELPALQRQRDVFDDCDACMLADEGRDNGDEDVHSCEDDISNLKEAVEKIELIQMTLESAGFIIPEKINAKREN